MSSDLLAGVGTALVGGAVAWLGLFAYVGRGAPNFFRRAYRNSFGLFGKAVIVFLLPAGVSMLLLGSAIAIGKNLITTNMLVAGLGLMLLAWLLFFIRPRWLLPRWLRSPRALQ